MLLLARCCVLPQVTHFLRTCLPMDVWPLCAPFDGAMLRLLERAAHLRAPLPPDAAAVVQLSLRPGGVGGGRCRRVSAGGLALPGGVQDGAGHVEGRVRGVAQVEAGDRAKAARSVLSVRFHCSVVAVPPAARARRGWTSYWRGAGQAPTLGGGWLAFTVRAA